MTKARKPNDEKKEQSQAKIRLDLHEESSKSKEIQREKESVNCQRKQEIKNVQICT